MHVGGVGLHAIDAMRAGLLGQGRDVHSTAASTSCAPGCRTPMTDLPANAVQVEGQQQRLAAQPRRGERRLAAGVPRPDHDHVIVLLRVPLAAGVGCRCRCRDATPLGKAVPNWGVACRRAAVGGQPQQHATNQRNEAAAGHTIG